MTKKEIIADLKKFGCLETALLPGLPSMPIKKAISHIRSKDDLINWQWCMGAGTDLAIIWSIDYNPVYFTPQSLTHE